MAELASLLPIVGIFLVFWLLIIRPAQRRQKALRSVQQGLAVGDRVVTSSGIFGTIARLDGDEVGLTIADGVVVTVARPAIGGLAPERAPEPGEDPTAPEQTREPDQD